MIIIIMTIVACLEQCENACKSENAYKSESAYKSENAYKTENAYKSDTLGTQVGTPGVTRGRDLREEWSLHFLEGNRD